MSLLLLLLLLSYVQGIHSTVMTHGGRGGRGGRLHGGRVWKIRPITSYTPPALLIYIHIYIYIALPIYMEDCMYLYIGTSTACKAGIILSYIHIHIFILLMMSIILFAANIQLDTCLLHNIYLCTYYLFRRGSATRLLLISHHIYFT